jgi:hypothetical protein
VTLSVFDSFFVTSEDLTNEMKVNLWTFIKERTRGGGIQKGGQQEDQTVSFEKIPDIEYLEDIEVGALLNE